MVPEEISGRTYLVGFDMKQSCCVRQGLDAGVDGAGGELRTRNEPTPRNKAPASFKPLAKAVVPAGYGAGGELRSQVAHLPTCNKPACINKSGN